MKKRLLGAIFASIMVFSLTACGGGDNATPAATGDTASMDEAPQLPELTGSWKQVNSNSEDSYQTAVITGNTIEIYWTDASTDTNSLYWAGSFVAPTAAGEPYSWDSANDKSRTSSALLASSDDTKTITYENGQLSYSASAFGSTQTIKLERIGNAPASDSTVSPSQTEFLPLEIKEYGYSMHSKYLYVAVVLHNPNTDKCVRFPTFRVTARDAEGIVLGTHDQVLSAIYPQHDFVYASQAFAVDQAPTTVEVEVVEPDEHNILNPQLMEYPKYTPLTAINTAIRDDRAVGEIINENDYAIDNALVSIIFRDADGKIVDGALTFVNKISAGGSVPFDMYLSGCEITDKYEVYANIW